MSSETTVQGGSVGFGGLLTLAFIVLKLCKVIDWSWVWVFSPLWISIGLVVLILLFYYLFVRWLLRRK